MSRVRRRSPASWSAEIASVAPHPEADKLQVCKVDAGQRRAAADRLRRAQCGARGMKVPWRWSARSCPAASPIKPREAARRRDRRACCARRASSAWPKITAGLLALPPMRRVGATCANSWSSTTRCSRSSSRPTGPIACRCWASRAKWPRSPARRSTLPAHRAGRGADRRTRAAGAHRGPGGVPALCRPRDPRRRRRARRRPAWMQRAPRARRHALDLRAGGHHELRDARARAAAARLRPRDARGAIDVRFAAPARR